MMSVFDSSRSFASDVAPLRRIAFLAAIYVGIASFSFYLAYELRFDFLVPEVMQQERVRLLAFVVGVKLVALICARQLASLMTYFSIPDLLRLFWAMGAASGMLLLVRLMAGQMFAVPRG